MAEVIELEGHGQGPRSLSDFESLEGSRSDSLPSSLSVLYAASVG